MTEPTAPWGRSVDEVAAALDTDPAGGLDGADAARRLVEVGPNALVEEERPGPWRLAARQFANTMTAVLGVAAAITLVVGDVRDTVVIAVILVLNAAIGFVQERKAEEAMAALKRMTTGIATVVRDGADRPVPIPELVPGDVVRLTAGDVVPADLRLADVQALHVNEAALTGESAPSAKTAAALDGGDLVAERHNMAFKGTAVTYGRATGVVVATGMATELGQIATLLQAHGVQQTPLQRRLAVLGRRMAAAAVVVCAVVFVAGVIDDQPVEEMFLTAVSLAVAAIPEGLPAVVTVSLALGARRMAERAAVIRRLPAVETLGSVSVICTDKTGTLTQNRMVVERVWTPAGVRQVTGDGYAPEGEVRGAPDAADPHLTALAEVAAGCNDATLLPPAEPGAAWTVTGDPTEGALLALAGKLGVERTGLAATAPRHAEIAFDADRRRMATVHRRDGRQWVAVKGALPALEPLLAPGEEQHAATAAQVADRWAGDGYRVLALAQRDAESGEEDLEQLERGLHLAGLVAIADPPRPEVQEALRSCHDAGIATVMITGDDPRTARAIASRLGLLTDEGPEVVMTGADLDALDDEAFARRVGTVRVYARTNPAQKLRIVEAMEAGGSIVAMTGDGVNDAPALRRADIGVAMGVIGTDVSKEASDMVLADDNFATIVHAVEEGRRIYDNIRRFVRYLLTTNSGEIWVMFLAPFFGLPVPLVAIQILWINLVTDGLPAIALGLEPAEADTMRRPPRPRSESILGDGLWQHAVWVGLLMAGVVLPMVWLADDAGWHWQTMAFTTLALLQLGHALAVRSERRSFFRLPRGTNRWLTGAVLGSAAAQLAVVYVPALQRVFDTEALDPAQLLVVLVASTTVFVAVELEKAYRRRPGTLDPGRGDPRDPTMRAREEGRHHASNSR